MSSSFYPSTIFCEQGRFQKQTRLPAGGLIALLAVFWLGSVAARAETNWVQITSMTRSASNVTLRWSVSDFAVAPQFEVQASPSPSGPWQTVTPVLSTNIATFAAPVGLNPVLFRIHCLANGKEVKDVTPPTPPANVSARVLNCNQVELTWSGSTDIGGGGVSDYQIYTNCCYYGNTRFTTTTLILSNLAPASSYRFILRAVDVSGAQSGNSLPFTIYTPSCDTLPPTIPTGLQVTSLNSTQLFLSWNQAAGQTGNVIRGYQVFRDGAFISMTERDGSLLTTRGKNSFTDTNFAPNTRHCYTVVAVDSLGRPSGQSQSVCATAQQPFFALAANSVTLPAVSTNGTITITGPDNLSWTASSSAAWLALTGVTSGFGGATVPFSVTANTNGTPRTATVLVAGLLFTVTQNGSGPPTTGIGNKTPELVGILPGMGNCNDLQVRGDFAYVANNSWGLSVISLSNAAAPVFLGSSSVPFDGRYVALSGNIACVTGSKVVYGGGTKRTLSVCYLIDVSDPFRPTVVRRLESDLEGYLEPSIAGNYAYVACGSQGVGVLDLNGPATTNFLGRFDTGGWAWSVTASGNYAYVANGAQGLSIFDLANPRTPSFVSALDTPGNARNVAVVGDIAYVADSSTLLLVDVKARTAPVSLSTNRMANGQTAMQVKVQTTDRTLAFIACAGGGLVTMDVTDPRNVTKRGLLPVSGGPNASTFGVVPRGSVAYVANYDGGLFTVNNADSATPVKGAVLMEWFVGNRVASQSGVAVASGTKYSEGGLRSINSFRVVDYKNPTNPVVVGLIETNDFGFLDLAMADGYAYVACGSIGLLVIDIRTPSNPVIVANLDTPGWAWSVTVSGNYAYVADGTLGLRIYDITDRRAPVFVSTLDTPGNARHIAVLDNLAYVADSGNFTIIDVRNKLAPVNLVTNKLSNGQTAVQVKVQNYQGRILAYVATSASGLLTIDASNPLALVKLPILAPTGGPNVTTIGVEVDGATAYVANYDGGLGIIDITKPDAPIQSGSVAGLQNVMAVSFDRSSRLVLAADTIGGMLVIRP